MRTTEPTLTDNQGRILQNLLSAGPCTNPVLARDTGMTVNSVTMVLETLMTRGHVVRFRAGGGTGPYQTDPWVYAIEPKILAQMNGGDQLTGPAQTSLLEAPSPSGV